MFDWIYSLSVPQIAGLSCAFFVAFAWLGVIFVRPVIRLFVRRQADLNSVLSSFLSVYGVLFGILMGLLAVAAFQDREDVDQSVTSEATALFAIFHIVSAYPEPQRHDLRVILRNYLNFVIDSEWPSMRKGVSTNGGDAVINQFQAGLTSFEPKSTGQEALHSEALSQFFAFLELRHQRLYNVTDGIPDIVWYVVFFGALLNICIMWLFEIRIMVLFLLSGMLALFIGMEISLIAILDRPLRGDFGLSPEVFERLYELVNNAAGT